MANGLIFVFDAPVPRLTFNIDESPTNELAMIAERNLDSRSPATNDGVAFTLRGYDPALRNEPAFPPVLMVTAYTFVFIISAIFSSMFPTSSAPGTPSNSQYIDFIVDSCVPIPAGRSERAIARNALFPKYACAAFPVAIVSCFAAIAAPRPSIFAIPSSLNVSSPARNTFPSGGTGKVICWVTSVELRTSTFWSRSTPGLPLVTSQTDQMPGSIGSARYFPVWPISERSISAPSESRMNRIARPVTSPDPFKFSL